MKIPKLVTLNGLKRKRDGVTIPFEEAKALHLGKKVYIYSGQWQQYWGINGSGYTPYTPENPKEGHSVAGIYTWEDALARTWHCGPEKKISYEFIQLSPETKLENLVRAVKKAMDFVDHNDRHELKQTGREASAYATLASALREFEGVSSENT